MITSISLLPPTEYEPFWEDEPTPEPPPWFHRFPWEEIPSWLIEDEHASPEFIVEGQSIKSRSAEEGEFCFVFQLQGWLAKQT